jgi:hypothetical protein
MVVTETTLFLLIEYRFLGLLRFYFAALAIADIWFLLDMQSVYLPYMYWYIQMALLIWQGFVAAQLASLLCPRLPRPLHGIIPAIILAASVCCGKPGTTWWNEYPTHHMLVYEIFCLAFLIIVLCFAVTCSSVPRFEGVAIGFGFLLAAQAVACMHRLYVGLSPFIWNLCWLAGICFIVHAIFTYDPEATSVTGK